jgi:hypothetical protein
MKFFVGRFVPTVGYGTYLMTYLIIRDALIPSTDLRPKAVFRMRDPDPVSIRLVDPYTDPESGTRRAKMTHKNNKKITKFHVLKCFSFEG